MSIKEGVNAPVRKMLKDEIVWASTHNCEEHDEPYINHWDCLLEEKPSGYPGRIEKIGVLDIEATNLQSDFGVILCYVIRDLNGTERHERSLTKAEIKSKTHDKELIKQLIKDMNKYDRFVVFYGGDYKYDIPFIRTRALKWGLDFFGYKEKYVTDLYTICKRKLRLHNGRLQTVCDFFDIPSKIHKIKGDIWTKAQAGRKKALDHIIQHCREDVDATAEVMKRMEFTFRYTPKSI